MKFIKIAENIDKTIIEYGTKLIQEQNNTIKKTLTIYNTTIFNNIHILHHAFLFKKFKNIDVWLISDIDEHLYKDSMNEYLKNNTSEHGKLVYNAFLKEKEKYYMYFSKELTTIKNKEGLLFILTDTDHKGNIIKLCHFHEMDLNEG